MLKLSDEEIALSQKGYEAGFLRDPDDELVLEAAINGRADVLVTFNVGDYFPAAQYFRLEVLRPAELLRRV